MSIPPEVLPLLDPLVPESVLEVLPLDWLLGSKLAELLLSEVVELPVPLVPPAIIAVPPLLIAWEPAIIPEAPVITDAASAPFKFELLPAPKSK